MPRILVSGLINIETTLKVDSFPIQYAPVRYPFFGINSTVAGVGLNISKALTMRGDDVRLLSVIGQDVAGGLVRQTLVQAKINDAFVVEPLATTCRAVIFYAPDGIEESPSTTDKVGLRG
jgi:ribokinase